MKTREGQTVRITKFSRQNRESPRYGYSRLLAAWGVHLYTTMGLVAAAAIAVTLIAPEHVTAQSFRMAFELMLLATLIDATDGTLARLVRVKEVLPGFDGRRLDDLIDFLTYACLPLLLIWRAGILPNEYGYCLILPLLASAYGFSQVSVKTDDGFFLGFPSYWNVVAFYLYLLKPRPSLSIAILLGLALLTFIPIRYLYPTQRGKLNRITLVLGAIWAVLLAWILIKPISNNFESPGNQLLGLVSLSFPVYYFGASWALSVWLCLRTGFGLSHDRSEFPHSVNQYSIDPNRD